MAANAKTNYAEPTGEEYEETLDDTESSFSQTLVDAHSDLDAAVDALVAMNKYNVAYLGPGSVAAKMDQQRKVVMALHSLMQDCNKGSYGSAFPHAGLQQHADESSLALSTDDMSAYTHLVQLATLACIVYAALSYWRMRP